MDDEENEDGEDGGKEEVSNVVYADVCSLKLSQGGDHGRKVFICTCQ